MSILDYIDALQAKFEGLFVDEKGEPIECTAPPVVESDLENDNVRAFLMAIRVCEGTAGPTGYQMLFGKKLFESFATHPNILMPFKTQSGVIKNTTAAGAYQIIKGTYDLVTKTLGVEGFNPRLQDRYAIELIRRRHALEDVKAGQFLNALRKCSPEWASLPYAPAEYDQPKQSIEFARRAYLSNGGVIAE